MNISVTMKSIRFFVITVLLISGVTIFSFRERPVQSSWIRINQLGYLPDGSKVAVWCSKEDKTISNWKLVDAVSGKVVYTGGRPVAFGAYGPFKQSSRLDFSGYRKPGRYYLTDGDCKSPEFRIDSDVYRGAADFCLRYMRQQRTGFNPFLKDSCHTRDGYALYGAAAGLTDSTYVDVTGGWHDASDYLQYSTTSANATWHLLAAYRDFKPVFGDAKQANGLEGNNGIPDILDEARWGLDWLLKMHPNENWMFNQIADDRDHINMRMPKHDSQYGRGNQRPVYLINGEPQQRGKFLNNTTGTSSTAAKFASAFALAQYLENTDSLCRKISKSKDLFYRKAISAYKYTLKKAGVTQTVSVRSPYIYAEDNWVDDMELAGASLHLMMAKNLPGSKTYNGEFLVSATQFGEREKITPWLGKDTAAHYQWYPFINLGHYEAARIMKEHEKALIKNPRSDKYFSSKELATQKDSLISYYKQGIQMVWQKANNNAFYRGIPFIWCSNNLTVSFAMQCYWYRQLTGDRSFVALEQANIDWLFGCNPWGTSMVYGLPANGDTPVDPHSAFTHLGKYPIDGGLVDGPVYTSIYKNLIGITLNEPDEYAEFQSNLAVYHDDYGDYSTNEPTMDGTASLIYLLAAMESEAVKKKALTINRGGIIRGDSSKKNIYLVFTGDEHKDGAIQITDALKKQQVKASFFFTGRFYREPSNNKIISELKRQGHYLGAHSNEHLLYCDWGKRDSLLVTREIFDQDLMANYNEMSGFGIKKDQAKYFLPPYEWYNDSISHWTSGLGFQLINFTPGTRANADYTWPELKNYQSSEAIYRSIIDKERQMASGLNGYILLLHIGTDPRRIDKFYSKIPDLISYLRGKGYHFQTVNGLEN